MRTRTLLLLLGTILASACTLRVDVAVSVDRDGAGEVRVALTADAAAVAAAAQAGADPLGDLQADVEASGGWEVTRTDGEDGSGTVELRRGFAGPADLLAITTDLAAQLDQPELRPFEPLSVTVTDEELAVAGGAGLQLTEAAVADLATTVEEAHQQLAETVDYTVSVRFPGEVFTTDPPAELTTDDPDGGGPTTATWTVAPGERLTFTATADRPPPDRTLLLIGLGAAAVVLTLGAAAALWRVHR